MLSDKPRHLLEFEKPIAVMEQEICRLEASQSESGRDFSDEVDGIRQRLAGSLRKTYDNLTPWETVLVARHPQRPLFRDYVRMIGKDFCELRGDRLYGDDKALVCGFARIGGRRVMLVGHHKGRDTRERIESRFGCAHPEGYRKALLKMRLAAKFGVPIVCLIDTPGAYPGLESEERGIASAIAVNLMELSTLPTPIIACVIGEGGSGGALGIGIADEVAVLQHSYYSVISPEGCAAILWKSGEHAPKAADALRLTAPDLLRLKLIDSVVDEPLGGAHRSPEEMASNLTSWIDRSLKRLTRLKSETLVKRRYDRLRNIGSFFEQHVESPAAEPAVKPKSSPRRAIEALAANRK